MTCDHVDKVLYDGQLTGLYQLGRVAFPLFGFVLAYNIARPDAAATGVHRRVLVRLGTCALVATPCYVLLFGARPLNILVTLFLAVSIAWCLDDRRPASYVTAIAMFIGAGALVEYWWPGILCFLAGWRWCRTGERSDYLMWICACAALFIVNANLWALAAVPLVLLAARTNLGVPRRRFVFYVYYPVHLAALLLVSRFAVV